MNERRPTPLGWLGQGLAYACFGVVIGTFASGPTYRPLATGDALIRLSFSHASQRKFECRQLSPAEVAALAPNMRTATECQRERLPVGVALEVDGDILYAAELTPAGLANDGAATAYERFVVPSGHHRVIARLRDSARAQGFDHEAVIDIELAAGEVLVVDFDGTAGGFEFR